MEVLVLTASPRNKGNSLLLAEAFIKGASKAGHKVTCFDTTTKVIKGCIACDACYLKGQPCVFNDDFNELAPLMEKASVIVLSTPLYWFTFPTQLKAALDKIYAFMLGRRKISRKKCLLLACGGEENIDIFDGLVRTYELMAGYLKWRNIGTILVPGMNEQRDIEKTDALEKAEALGLKLANL